MIDQVLSVFGMGDNYPDELIGNHGGTSQEIFEMFADEPIRQPKAFPVSKTGQPKGSKPGEYSACNQYRWNPGIDLWIHADVWKKYCSIT